MNKYTYLILFAIIFLLLVCFFFTGHAKAEIMFQDIGYDNFVIGGEASNGDILFGCRVGASVFTMVTKLDGTEQCERNDGVPQPCTFDDYAFIVSMKKLYFK